MTTKVPINHFDRSKPFYPLVMNYLILLIGFKDLAACGIIKGVEKCSPSVKNTDVSALINGIVYKYQKKKFDEVQLKSHLSKIGKGLEKILGPLDLRSEFQGNNIRVDIDEIALDIMQNNAYLISLLMRSAGSLLIIAHETGKRISLGTITARFGNSFDIVETLLPMEACLIFVMKNPGALPNGEHFL